MLEAGLLRLNVLRLDGRAVAVYYGFTHRERAYYYLGGFDPEFSALSPGTLAVAYAIEQALAEGVKTFDFLRGDERYKYLWGAEDTFTYRRTLSYHDSGLEPPISL
jgi:CelD/BcsL family acetyltransferase involved in cellulose biosynthesis